MKELEILQKYSNDSFCIGNSLYIKILDTNIYFVLDIYFTDNIILEEYFDTEDGIEINGILKDNEFRNKAVLHSMYIRLKTHSKNNFLLYYIISFYFETYKKIPTLSIVSDDSMYCSYYNLFYKIQLPLEAINNEFLDAIKIKQNDFYSLNFLDKYYRLIEYHGWQDINKYISISLEEIKSISTQTKVRRLGYIKMMLSMFNKSSYYPISIFNRKVEEEAQVYNDDLLQYTNNKGIINLTKTGNSSKQYIEVSISLKLLYAQNNAYKLSKYGKVFNVLNNQLNFAPDNFFKLSNVQKSYFLFLILQNDGLYLWILLDLIYFQNNKTTFKGLKQVFQNYLIEHLEYSIKHSKVSTKIKSNISKKIKRIKAWEKPEVYLEHIIEPRINWLLDLDIIDEVEFSKNNISLSHKGMILLNTLSSYFDIFLERSTILSQLRCMDFFSLLNEMYVKKAIDIEENDFKLIDTYISESFLLFKTIAPNRVTASQAILYTCFMMLFKEDKVVNFCTIQSYLKSNKNINFIFDWYKTDNDGSIRRKK